STYGLPIRIRWKSCAKASSASGAISKAAVDRVESRWISLPLRPFKQARVELVTEVLLIRHGETLWNQQGRMQGQNDSPLTPLGLEQARQLGRRLKDVTFTTLYSSDLGR